MFLLVLAHAIGAVLDALGAFGDGVGASQRPGVTGGIRAGQLRGFVIWAAVALSARALLRWIASLLIDTAGDAVGQRLRDAGVRSALLSASLTASREHRDGGDSDDDSGADSGADESSFDVGSTTGVLVDGVTDVRNWVVDYLPSAAMAVVGPLLAFVVVLVLDPLTTVILVFTGPMLLLLLAVIGRRIAELNRRRASELAWLRSLYLDLLEGLPTLRLFGRGADGAKLVEATSRRFSETTMEVLRTAFQTSLVMEWAATAATALVAVEVSFRMTSGDLGFSTALAVLMITPEFFVPLRDLGLHYHTGSRGDAAAEQLSSLLGIDEPASVPETSRPGRVGLEGAEPVRVAQTMADARPSARVELRGVSYRYPAASAAAVTDIDLTIEPGQTVAICGPSGAGKSTIAALVVGLVSARTGTISVDGAPHPGPGHGIAWVPQQPAILSGTVAENIALADPCASPERIRAAARSAGAIGFIDALPDGIRTLLGEGATTLSGGERQRIAVARAHLSRAPLVVLDEFTAHLDPETESAVLGSTIELLRGRSALVITHREESFRSADVGILLRDGCVIDRGPPGELIGRHGTWEAMTGDHGASPAEQSRGTAPLSGAPGDTAPRNGAPGDSGVHDDTAPAASSPGPSEVAGPDHLWEVRDGHLGWVALTTGLSAATTASGIGLMVLAAWLISRAAELGTTAGLALGITGVRLCAVSRVASRYGERLVGHIGTFRWITTLRVRFFEAIEPLAPLRDTTTSRGDLLTRVLADIDTAGERPLRVVVPFATAAIVTAAVTVVVWVFSAPAAVGAAVALVVGASVLPAWVHKRTASNARRAAQVRGRLEGDLVEGLSARAELVAWGRTDRVTDAAASSSRELGAIETSLTGIRGRSDVAVAVLSGAAVITTFAIAALAVSAGSLAPVLLAGVPLAVLSSFEAVGPLGTAAEDLNRCAAATRRLEEIVRSNRSNRESRAGSPAEGPQQASAEPAAVAQRPSTPAIELQGVTFAHRSRQTSGGGPGDDSAHHEPEPGTPVLVDADLEVPRGSTVLIRGASGAGKSTLVDLLCGFAVADAGRVLVMGHDVAVVGQQAMTELLTVVAQADHLFDTTVRDNLALAAPEADDTVITVALERAGATGFVSNLPAGSDHRIGHDGERLSGGERQRLLIARALLRPAPVLVLDEATTHLDAPSEARVTEGIRAWQQDGDDPRTVVFVSHHVPAGLQADVTFELHEGRVSGAPAPPAARASAPR